MADQPSALEIIRQYGLNQLEEQRINILDTAEKLFLEKGIASTNMKDIAAASGINRATLYRYFPDIHPIIFTVEVKMINRLVEVFGIGDHTNPLQYLKVGFIQWIDRFAELKNVFRYMGMFDHHYGSHYPNEELATWFKQEINRLGWAEIHGLGPNASINATQIAMISNCMLSFMQRLAAHGEIMSEEQGVSIDAQLTEFKEWLVSYFDRLARR